MPEQPRRQGTILAFDFGTKRIGVAIGNTLTGTARPLTVLKANDGAPDWQQLTTLVTQWQPVQLVVGLPLNMDGTESELSTRARRFANRLGGRLSLPVATVDERLSSFEARGEIMRSEQRPGARPEVDALAASLILETWLSSHSTNDDQRG